jgi:hypothetical protein
MAGRVEGDMTGGYEVLICDIEGMESSKAGRKYTKEEEESPRKSQLF